MANLLSIQMFKMAAILAKTFENRNENVRFSNGIGILNHSASGLKILQLEIVDKQDLFINRYQYSGDLNTRRVRYLNGRTWFGYGMDILYCVQMVEPHVIMSGFRIPTVLTLLTAGTASKQLL